jgi:hypothetical protein
MEIPKDYDDMSGMTRQEWLEKHKQTNKKKFHKLLDWHQSLKERTSEEIEKYKQIKKEGFGNLK